MKDSILDRIPNSIDLIVKAVVLNQTVTINKKKIEGCAVMHVNAMDANVNKIIIRPKQVEANADKDFAIDETLVGKLINFPTREQIAGKTGYTNEKKEEIIDDKSGVFVQPFINYVGSEADAVALKSDLRDDAKTSRRLSNAMSMSDEQSAFLKENPHLASIL